MSDGQLFDMDDGMKPWQQSGHQSNPSDKVTNRDAKALSLLHLLHLGSENMLTGYKVAELLGVHQRAVGGIVHRARELGICVGSAHGLGYYLVETEEELEETIHHIEKRISGLRETAALLRANWDKEKPVEKRAG